MAENGKLMLIDQVRELPDKEKFTTVSVQQGFTERSFNGIAGMITRRIKISGVRLVWDEYQADTQDATDEGEVVRKLYNYSGSTDIELLEMYADEVVIRSPLVFPQTEVWIVARRLIFERNGSITTTPLNDPTPAYTTKRDSNGRPLNASGQIEARAGAKGRPGGSIVLALQEGTVVPDRSRRLFLKGSRGQDGENGGYLDYLPQPNQREVPGDRSYPVLIGEENVYDLLPPGTSPSSWRFADGWLDEFRNNFVLHVRLVPFDDTVGTLLVAGVNPALRAQPAEIGEKVWPGGVPDAFPSGRGGDGGDGGTLWNIGSLHWTNAGPATESFPESGDMIGFLLPNSLEVPPGAPGTSQEIPACVPQFRTDSPRPPVFMTLNPVRYLGPSYTKVQPIKQTVRCPFPIVPGKGYPASEGQSGKPPEFIPWPDRAVEDLVNGSYTRPSIHPGRAAHAAQIRLGPHPNQVEPALQYARAAYLNGHRAEASAILETYQKAIEAIPAQDRNLDLVGQANEIAALLSQLRNNLDYYGNPPGWLPRLSLLSNLQLFMADQRNAVSLLYYAYRLERSWDQVANRAQLLKSTRQALSQAVDRARTSFLEGLSLLGSGSAELAETQQQAAEIGRRIKALNQTITDSARDKAREQAILSGVSSLAAGLCQVIPVGQPFLGSMGKTVFNLVGNIDLTNPDAVGVAFSFAKGAGNGLKTFVETNKKAIEDESEGSFTRQLKLVEGSLEATEKEITTINDQIDTEFDSKVASRIETINEEIAQLEKEATTVVIDSKKKKQRELKARTLKEELALYRSRKLHEAVVTLRKEKAEIEKSGGLTLEEKAAKEKLLGDLAALEGKKATLTESSTRLKEKHEDQKKFLSQTLARASDIGAGVGTMADGLSQLFAEVNPNDPKVQAIRDKIATSAEFKDELESLMKDVDDLTDRKRKLMEGVDRAQKQLAESCATISKSLLQGAAVVRQLQEASEALDLDVKAYMRGLRQRSEDRLRKSLYHVVKSYEYHNLKRVPEDLFNTNRVIEGIKKLEEEKLKGQEGALLSEAQFKEIYDTVFKDEFSKLADGIVGDLQHFKPSRKNQYVCCLEDRHLIDLNRDWRFKFRIVDTFKKTGGHDRDVIGARIIGIAMKKLDVKSPARGLSLDIEFTHSGEHVIVNPAGDRYVFRIGKYPVEAQDGSGLNRWVDDQPIAWRMTYNAAESDTNKQVLPDTVVDDDEIVLYLMREFKERGSDLPVLQEHRPALTSEITLTIDGGLDPNDPREMARRKEAKPFSIDALEFDVFFTRQ